MVVSYMCRKKLIRFILEARKLIGRVRFAKIHFVIAPGQFKTTSLCTCLCFGEFLEKSYEGIAYQYYSVRTVLKVPYACNRQT